jgi:hypothetical protein
MNFQLQQYAFHFSPLRHRFAPPSAPALLPASAALPSPSAAAFARFRGFRGLRGFFDVPALLFGPQFGSENNNHIKKYH